MVVRSFRMFRSDCPRSAASLVVLYSRRENKTKPRKKKAALDDGKDG